MSEKQSGKSKSENSVATDDVKAGRLTRLKTTGEQPKADRFSIILESAETFFPAVYDFRIA